MTIYLAFDPTKGRKIQHQGELDMSVYLTNAVSILEEHNKQVKNSQKYFFSNTRCAAVLRKNNLSYLLKSLQMKGKHWWGGRDQHLLHGISIDIFFGS